MPIYKLSPDPDERQEQTADAATPVPSTPAEQLETPAQTPQGGAASSPGATDLSASVTTKASFSPEWDADHQDPAVAAAVHVRLASFSAEGTVIMDASTPADTYELGFVQNLLSSTTTTLYVDSEGKPFRKCHFKYKTPILDGKKDSKPWMRSESVISINSKDYIVNASDRPNDYFVWDSTTDPSETTLDKAGKPGRLSSSSGKDSFVTWLVMRNKATKALSYRHWVTWEIDKSCKFDHATQKATNTGQGGSVSGQGTGQGAHTPVVSGSVANGSVKIEWTDP